MMLRFLHRCNSISDIPNFVRARALAAKADAAIDPAKFQEVIARHSSEGYDSYTYFDKQLWLRSKMMRVVELGLDKSAQASVLDLGYGAGYFLYCCKYLGHNVHGIDLPDYEFYQDLIALWGCPGRALELKRTRTCRLSTSDATSLPPIGSASMDIRRRACGGWTSGISSSTTSRSIFSILGIIALE
jgi:hypothetical protein